MPNGKGTSRAKRNGLAPSYCEVCGYNRAVTKHRIVARRRGGEYIEGNVIALCRNCHWECDQMGLVPADLLYAIVRKRLERGTTEAHWEDGELERRVRCIAAARGRASAPPCGTCSNCTSDDSDEPDTWLASA